MCDTLNKYYKHLNVGTITVFLAEYAAKLHSNIKMLVVLKLELIV